MARTPAPKTPTATYAVIFALGSAPPSTEAVPVVKESPAMDVRAVKFGVEVRLAELDGGREMEREMVGFAVTLGGMFPTGGLHSCSPVLTSQTSPKSSHSHVSQTSPEETKTGRTTAEFSVGTWDLSSVFTSGWVLSFISCTIWIGTTGVVCTAERFRWTAGLVVACHVPILALFLSFLRHWGKRGDVKATRD